jgi:uncharacterized protein (TIGR03086 family)
MASPSDQLQYHVTTLRGLVAGVRPDQWNSPTPCDKWTVHDLVNHVVGGGQMFAASFRGETVAMDPDGPLPDMLGDDPLAAFDGAIAAFVDSVNSPGAMERDAVLPFATLPAPIALNIAKFDLLVHCWDLAQATGQPFDPPEDVVLEGQQMAEMIIQPPMRDGDTFYEVVVVTDDASSLERLVAFSGRSV